MFIRSFVAACAAAVALSLGVSEVDQTSAAINEILSQTEAAKLSPTICQRAPTRNKQAVPDFYSIYGGSKVFTDTAFPHNRKATLWLDAGETLEDGWTAKQEIWKRAKDAFPGKTLYGSKGVTIHDIRQGQIGNCGYLAATAALAAVPGRVEKIFLNNKNELSKNGIYGVNFYSLGVPHTVIVDDYLPLRKDKKTGNLGTWSAMVSADGAVWGVMLEKAFAKYHGNYRHMQGELPTKAIRTLYGAPWVHVSHASYTADQMWDKIQASEQNKDIISASAISNPTPQPAVVNGEPVGYTSKEGICYDHAYSVLGTKEVTDAAGKTHKLLKMRNPWGGLDMWEEAEVYSGPWSDNSKLWTADLKKQAGYVNAHDGVFFMPLKLYMKSFYQTEINFNADKMSRSHFLVLNDTNKETREEGTNCEGKCSFHKFTIKSKTTQTVHLKASTWEYRQYPLKCQAQVTARHETNGKFHNFKVFGGDIATDENDVFEHEWQYGENEPYQVTMKAGVAYTMTVEMFWTDPEIAKDFSVLAQGVSGGAIDITHWKGLKTAKLPVIARKAK